MHPKQALIQKGVRIPNPESVDIGDDINPDRIAGREVTIYAGCKLFGAKTFVSPGAQIGLEGPVTIQDAYIGPNVSLKGGFFQEAVFLEGSSCGLGAHVRRGTILEEYSSIAHTVGLKQTILFPYVTLGSLINFCDCLMAGGTGRRNHSEVGSSYIHFNFTPSQDKATPSLIGDVPRGVMLNQSPVFLGGQGGLVGPCRLAYGTVVAAGSICRKDQLRENVLVVESAPRSARIPFKAGAGYRNLKRVLNHNLVYIGQLYALNQWYRQVRGCFAGSGFAPQLLDGLIITLKKGIDERIKQLGRLGEKIAGSGKNTAGSKESTFFKNWDKTAARFQSFFEFEGRSEDRDVFLSIIEGQRNEADRDYLSVIRSLSGDQADCGSRWLQGIADHVVRGLMPE